MTPAERVLQKEKCRRWAHSFIFDEKVLKTKDEHDQEEPVKPFPDEPYLRILLDCLLVSGRLLEPGQASFALHALSYSFLERVHDIGLLPIEKSRQVMVTWLVSSFLLWRAKYRPHQLILVQSKREDDAANLVFNKDPTVARISFMEHSLPAHLRTVDFGKGATYAHLFFPNGSHIWGIPEGGDVIRSNTATVIYMDEAAFMAEFDASFTAARPAVDGGGQLVLASSANPGAYCDLVEGEKAAA